MWGVKLKYPIIINENISFYDIIFKYLIRDFLLGCIRCFPSAVGVLLRMLAYKLCLKKCGKGLRIGEFTTIKFPENISIGDNVSINEYDWFDGNGGIEIGNYSSIGPRVNIISFSHGYEDKNKPIKLQPKVKKMVRIEDEVWIGANVTITFGVRIGKGSIIGAGSLVNKDVEPYSIVAGVPARCIGMRR